MKSTLLLMLLLVFSFWGCSTKDTTKQTNTLYEKRKSYKLLQKTEYINLEQNGTSHGFILATFLYDDSSKKDDFRGDTFIVGIQFHDDKSIGMDEVKRALKAHGLLAIKDEEKDILDIFDANRKKEYIAPVLVEKLSKTEVKKMGVAMVTPWSSYFKVTFPRIESNNVTLTFNDGIHNKVTLSFSRGLKYIHTKKSF